MPTHTLNLNKNAAVTWTELLQLILYQTYTELLLYILYLQLLYVHSSTDDSTPRLTKEREQQTNCEKDSDLDRTIIHLVPTATVRQQTQPKRLFTTTDSD